MLGESAKLQLLKNATEERETKKAQAAIHVPKGETKRRAQITYLIAKVMTIFFSFNQSFNHLCFPRLNMMILI